MCPRYVPNFLAWLHVRGCLLRFNGGPEDRPGRCDGRDKKRQESTRGVPCRFREGGRQAASRRAPPATYPIHRGARRRRQARGRLRTQGHKTAAGTRDVSGAAMAGPFYSRAVTLNLTNGHYSICASRSAAIRRPGPRDAVLLRNACHSCLNLRRDSSRSRSRRPAVPITGAQPERRHLHGPPCIGSGKDDGTVRCHAEPFGDSYRAMVGGLRERADGDQAE
jgi:hypothetical protein